MRRLVDKTPTPAPAPASLRAAGNHAAAPNAEKREEGADASATPRKGFKCLDVQSVRQGEILLHPTNFFMLWTVALGIYWQTKYLLCTEAENQDARDMIDAYQQTQRSVEDWHTRHFFVGVGKQYKRSGLDFSDGLDKIPSDWARKPTLHMCSHTGAASSGGGASPCRGRWSKVTTKDYVRRQGNLRDPRLWEALRIDLMKVPDTGYEIYSLSSVVSLALGGPGVLSTDIAQRSLALALHPKAEASCQPGVCEAHMHLVPMFQVTRVPDSLTKVQVRHLSKVEVEIGFYKSSGSGTAAGDSRTSQLSAYETQPDAHWEVLRVRATYADDDAWQGEPHQTVSFERSRVSVPLAISDVSQPQAWFPSFTGTQRFTAGFTLFPCMAIALLVVRVVLQVWIETRSRENQGVPPPFFAGFRKYRGW